MSWPKVTCASLAAVLVSFIVLVAPKLSNYQILRARPYLSDLGFANLWICRALEGPGRALCLEGVAQSTGLQDLKAYSKASIAMRQNLSRFKFELPELQLFWAVAFGSSAFKANVNILELQAPASEVDARVFKYLVDGWTIEQALTVGPNVALARCRLELGRSFDKICRWSAGRARFFLSEKRSELNDPTELAGYDFAVYFLGESKSELVPPGGTMALLVRGLLGGKAVQGNVDCLKSSHMSECLVEP